jgi:chromosome segregation ATPase
MQFEFDSQSQRNHTIQQQLVEEKRQFKSLYKQLEKHSLDLDQQLKQRDELKQQHTEQVLRMEQRDAELNQKEAAISQQQDLLE